MTWSVISLFCGLGGLDLGFEWEGYSVAWANDNSRAATESYRLNFGIEPVLADINELSLGEIPDGDIIIGGPPCQSFSLVGKREEHDPRGRLVFRFLEIVRNKRPRCFVLENVPGMAASRVDGQRLPEFLREAFEDLGYKAQAWRMLATEYLVPQRRKRIILVGARDFTPREPDPERYAEACYGIRFVDYDLSARAAIGDLGSCAPKGEKAMYRDGVPSVFAMLMRSAELEEVTLHERPRMSETDQRLLSYIPPGGNYRDVPDHAATDRILRFKREGGRTTTYGRLHPDRPAYTVNTYFRRPNVGCNFHYEEQRLITPREAMRFQSIPDHFELRYNSQDERNALIGNAVPPLMARAIAWALNESARGSRRKGSGPS
jgi:DNA (cytosine-5)-methyltransferase 1